MIREFIGAADSSESAPFVDMFISKSQIVHKATEHLECGYWLVERDHVTSVFDFQISQICE